MRRYAALVPDEKLRNRFLDRIIGEFQRTQSELGHFFPEEFATRRPRLAFTLDIREQPLSVLHAQQIELLRTWRALSVAGDHGAAEAMIPDLLVSINALASGLRTTG
jgi:phosphoenolpyruvate carboxylase